jgi:prepilin-type N-terminal cleavage/methylation domain-containing protein
MATDNLRRTTCSESGFTLVELLVVLVIIGVLLAISVSSYLGYRDRAADQAAQANLRMGMSAAEAYYSDSHTYVGMDHLALEAIDSGLSTTLRVTSAGANTYCIRETVSNRTWSVRGPGSAPAYVPNATCS